MNQEKLKDLFEKSLLKYKIKSALKEVLVAQNEKWITIHPHGDLEINGKKDYRRLKIEDDETVKEAIERKFGKKEKESKETIESLTEKRKQMWKDLMKKYEGNIKKIPAEEKKKYQELSDKIKALKEGKSVSTPTPTEKKPEEKKPEPKKEEKKTGSIEEQIKAIVDKSRKLKEKYYKAVDDVNVPSNVSDKLYEEWQNELNKVDELSKQMPYVGKTVTLNGREYKITKYDATHYYNDGAYFLESNSGGWMSYTAYYKSADLEEAIKESEIAEQKKKEFRKERESMRGKNVKYVKGAIPTGKNIEEITKIAYKYDLADNIDFGKLAPFVANDMISVANDMYAEFPEIREQSKYYGSLQGRNTDIVNEAFAIHGERIYNKMKKSYKDWINEPNQEKIKRYYGSMEDFEKAVWEKVNDRIKQVYHPGRASGEIAHSRWSPPHQTGIVYNEKFKNRKDFKESEWTKFHPEGAGTIKGVVYHEFGHQLDKWIRTKNGTSTTAYRTLQGLHKNYNRDKEKMTNELSSYAYKSFEEFIAEGFSEYKCNQNCRPLAKQIGELITQAYKETKNGK